MPYVRPYIYTNKQTDIPDFRLCYPCKCLARYARSPINKYSEISIELPLIVSRSLRSLANKQTSPIFFHFYPCKCLARYARSPIKYERV